MPRPPEPAPAAIGELPAPEDRPPRLLIRSSPTDGSDPSWLEFTDPVGVLETSDRSKVMPILEEVDAATQAGLYAAGFITYEAAPALDSALSTLPAGDLPLVWFTLCRKISRHRHLPWVAREDVETLDWQPSVEPKAYRRAVRSIHAAIEQGLTYQANFTFRQRTPFKGDPWPLFARMVTTQPVRYAAYLEQSDFVLCSASPELFFRLDGSQIVAQPMKGTSRRGLTPEEDRRLALALYDSPKDRAENLMIVDMIRNDLGRIAESGSVDVESLFDLETYESVHQLTSRVTARTKAPLPEILRALFPCASITGAPKVRTVSLLAELESTPRGIYTGAIGYITPDRQAQFNVAIRTVHVDRRRRTAEYGTGSGIVWDSDADEEYRECEAKALVLEIRRPEFSLLETLRWDPEDGFFLLDRHLDRMLRSAGYFGFAFDRKTVRQRLLDGVGDGARRPRRVRLHLHRHGEIEIEQLDLGHGSSDGWSVALSPLPVDRSDVFLYHKTTARQTYDRASESAPGFDEVLLWNADGYLTEGTIANLAFSVAGQRFTPPVSDGLLAGTFREELLDRGELAVRSLHRRELEAVEAFWLFNSVRKWIRVERVAEHAGGLFRTIWRNTRPVLP